MNEIDRNKTYIFTEDYVSPDGDLVEANLTVAFGKLSTVLVKCWIVDANEELPTFRDKGLQYLLDKEIIQDYKEYKSTPNKNGWSLNDLDKADQEYEASLDIAELQ